MRHPVEALKEYIRFPSVSTDPAYAEGMRGAREYAASLLEQLGFTVEVVATDLHPILLAERLGSPDWPHVVLYGHYDVQPADPSLSGQMPLLSRRNAMAASTVAALPITKAPLSCTWRHSPASSKKTLTCRSTSPT